jgi:hypothetical protein
MIMNGEENYSLNILLIIIILKFSQFNVYICVTLLQIFYKFKIKHKIEDKILKLTFWQKILICF